MAGKLRVYGKGARPRSFVARLGRPAARLAALLAAALLAAAPARADDGDGYRFGDGLHFAGSGLNLGGYATATYEDLRHRPSRSALDNLSLFVWWEGEGRWKFFSELDYENVLSSRSATGEDDERYLALERLYLDYALSGTSSLRLGKFLTPIGRWNMIHATPLVWTSSRPQVTLNTFPTNVTGLMLSGTLSALGGTDYALYASGGDEIRPNPSLDPFEEVIGGHLGLPAVANLRIGLSYASFEQQSTPGENKELFGLDFVWSADGYEISGEGVYRTSDIGREWDEKGAFVQAVAPLGGRLYAVGRYEYFHKAQAVQATRLWVAGFNYRLTPAVVLKAEWVGSRHNDIGAPTGFMSSLSVLF